MLFSRNKHCKEKHCKKVHINLKKGFMKWQADRVRGTWKEKELEELI